eukprot:1761575-Pyramimonas_sp.AAC.1
MIEWCHFPRSLEGAGRNPICVQRLPASRFYRLFPTDGYRRHCSPCVTTAGLASRCWPERTSGEVRGDLMGFVVFLL